MCGCTCVGRPACCACTRSRERTWLGVSRVPRRLTNSAGSPGAASRRAQRHPVAQRRAAPGTPTGTLRRLPPLPSTWALASAAVDPAALRRRRPKVQTDQLGNAQAAAVQQFDDAVVARVSAGSTAAVAAVLGQRHRLLHRRAPWASGLPALGARTPSHRVGRDDALRGPTSGTGRATPRARWRCCARARPPAAQPRGPAAHVRAAATVVQRDARWPQRLCSGAKRRRTARACAPPGGVRRAGARGGAAGLRRARGSRIAAAPASCGLQAAGSSRDKAGARRLADAHEEIGAHVGGVARRVGRAEHAAGRRRRRWAPSAQRRSSPSTRTAAASSSQPTASKPALAPQYGRDQAGGEALRSRRSRAARRRVARTPRGAPDAQRALRDQELARAASCNEHPRQAPRLRRGQQRARVQRCRRVGDGRGCPGRGGSSR